jgi:IrrE N-terminal-like domain
LAVFYLAEAPRSFDALHDFRAGTSLTTPPAVSPDLTFEIRKAYDRREWALELMSELQLSPTALTIGARLDEDSEVAAQKIRTVLGVRTEAQALWRIDNEAFREWRGLLERVGILTFQATGVELEEARGFSISLKPLPAVVVNIKDAPRGRIFTMLHEVTHLALNDGGICDLDDNQRRNASARIEAYCNRVAGAVLFPKNDLLLRMRYVATVPAICRGRMPKSSPSQDGLAVAEKRCSFACSRWAARTRRFTTRSEMPIALNMRSGGKNEKKVLPLLM